MKEFEDLFRRLERELAENAPGLGFGPLMGEPTRLEAEGLSLEVQTVGFFPLVTLTVTREGAPVTRVTGRSLEDVLARHPELQEHAGMPALLEKWREWQRERAGRGLGFDGFFRRGATGPSFSMSSNGKSVVITHDADGVTVVVSKEVDGRPVTKEYRGESLQQLREQHPELAEDLPDIHVEVRPPQVFRGLQPLPPAPPVVTPLLPDQETRFGVGLAIPEAALAHQLRLADGVGILVTDVLPDSQAEALGVERYDVILSADGVPAADLEALVAQLRTAARTDAPLRLDVIRAGERRSLAR
jgi:hypothetical protein